MEDADGKNEKKFKVVDKRENYLDDEDETTTGDGDAEDSQRSHDHDDVEESHDHEHTEEPQKKRDVNVGDAMQLALNVLRERALLSMGLVIAGDGVGDQNFEQARKISEIFRSLANKFSSHLESETPGAVKQIPPFEDSLNFIFNMLQGQILIHIGLIADPSSGLIAKKTDQARIGIDFFSALLEETAGLLNPDSKRSLDALLSDLRINFVSQLNKP